MKQLIKDVLEDIADSQPNLHSETARENIANLIVATIRSKGKGWYLNLNHTKELEEEDKKILESHKTEEWKVKESWVCSICGKNTYDVDWDYIGTGTNHLGCEFEDEKRVTNDRRKKTISSTPDRRRGDRREKNWSQKKHEDKVFNQAQLTNDREYPYNSFVRNKEDLQKLLYTEMTTDGLPEGGDSQAVRESRKLAEEIVDDKDTGYIYESPDSGKTVYKRKVGESERELVKDWKKINVRT